MMEEFQAINILIATAHLAQKSGSLTLEEASTVNVATKILTEKSEKLKQEFDLRNQAPDQKDESKKESSIMKELEKPAGKA